MQFDSFQRETPTINVSALIDVVFILLIFVVLAANFDRIREMNVTLPTAHETSQPADQSAVLTLPVDEPMKLDGNEVSEEDLPAQLEIRAREVDTLVIVGDGRVDLNRTVQLFDRAAAAGFESVSIATREAAQ